MWFLHMAVQKMTAVYDLHTSSAVTEGFLFCWLFCKYCFPPSTLWLLNSCFSHIHFVITLQLSFSHTHFCDYCPAVIFPHPLCDHSTAVVFPHSLCDYSIAAVFSHQLGLGGFPAEAREVHNRLLLFLCTKSPVLQTNCIPSVRVLKTLSEPNQATNQNRGKPRQQTWPHLFSGVLPQGTWADAHKICWQTRWRCVACSHMDSACTEQKKKRSHNSVLHHMYSQRACIFKKKFCNSLFT